MAKAKTYLAKIRKQVKADHNGTIPENLELTIENYAQTLELRDVYMEEVKKEPMVVETGSMGQTSRKQNPLWGKPHASRTRYVICSTNKRDYARPMPRCSA